MLLVFLFFALPFNSLGMLLLMRLQFWSVFWGGSGGMVCGSAYSVILRGSMFQCLSGKTGECSTARTRRGFFASGDRCLGNRFLSSKGVGNGRLIFIHIQCWEVLPFLTIQRQRCIKFRVLRAQDFDTPLALNCQKGQHLPALEVYKNQTSREELWISLYGCQTPTQHWIKILHPWVQELIQYWGWSLEEGS